MSETCTAPAPVLVLLTSGRYEARWAKIATELADGHPQFFNLDPGRCNSIALQQVLRSPGLHRGWAKPMLDRCRDLVQQPNQTRPTVAEATDEVGKEARASYHYTHAPGYGD